MDTVNCQRLPFKPARKNIPASLRRCSSVKMRSMISQRCQDMGTMCPTMSKGSLDPKTQVLSTSIQAKMHVKEHTKEGNLREPILENVRGCEEALQLGAQQQP